MICSRKIVYFFLTLMITVFSVSASKNACADNNNEPSNVDCAWEFQGEDDGIKSFFSCRENSPITQFRAVATLDFSMEVLLEVLADVSSYPKWMPDVLETTVLKEFHNGMERGNFYIHIVYNSQWPVSDRDVVLETVPKTDWNKGEAIVTLRKLHNFSYPLKKEFIRMDDLDSEFKFEYLERTKTRVTYTLFSDIGGLISPKLAKLQTESVPHEMIEGLRRIGKDKKYIEAAAREYY